MTSVPNWLLLYPVCDRCHEVRPFAHVLSLSHCPQDFSRDDKKVKQGAGGLVDGLVKKRKQLLLNRDMV